MNDYAHPETLVETDWLAEHLNDPSDRIVESNEDILPYDTGHIAGAVHIDWRRDFKIKSNVTTLIPHSLLNWLAEWNRQRHNRCLLRP
jgi:3-mercaptopyruvate sulfurtransferase SseA